MGLFSRIKNWFKRTFSGGGGGSSSSSSRASRVSNYGGGGSRSYRDYSSGRYKSDYEDRKEREKRQRQEQARKRQTTTDALASISKRTDALSSGRSSSVASSATSTGTTRVLARINEKAKATPPDPKETARRNVQKNATAQLKKISDNRKAYNKATNNRYNVDKNGTKARIAQKSQAYDVNAEKYETKQHPIATSFARGAASGVTFGGSELLAQRSKNRQRTGVEQYYQKNKNKWAEMGGEVAGSLVGFGLTGGASAKAVGKAGSVAERLVPKTANATKGFVARGTEKLASSAAIRRAAEKEAIKRFGAEGATKEVINQIARRRVSTAMAELGKDAAINMTTGLASDLSHSYLDASKDGTFDRGEFAKSMATNAALNTVLGGATSFVPAFRVGRNFDDAIEGAVRNVAEEQADDAVKVTLNRRRRTDVRMPEVRPQTLDEAVERAATDTVERSADDAVRAVEPAQNIPVEPQRPRTPTEVMTGYKSNGYRKRVADAKKRIKSLLDNGDTRGAREEIDRAVDDIVRNTRIEEPLEDNIVEIKEVLRNTPISTSTKYKTDAGYKSGGFNEFRKGNFGSLKLTNDGTPIDELWGALQERFGRSLFPDEIDVPSEQLQYLSDLAKTKGRELELPDEEIAHLREQLSESLWESANKGRDHAPFNANEEEWLTEQAASRAVSDEELAALEQRAIEDGLIDERVPATEPRPTEPSQFAQVDEGMEGIDAEAERQAQRTLSQTQEEGLATKIEEDATGRPMTDEEIKARRENTAKAKKAEAKINPRRMPKGERLTERVTKDIEGADFESATKPASAKEIIEAEKKHVRGQASNYENVVSRGGTSLASATGNEAELNVIKSKIDDGSLNYARVKNKEKYEWAVKDFVDNKETVSKKMLQYADDIDSIPASQLVDTHYQAHAVMKMMRSQLDNPELTQAERDAAREIYGAAASLTQQLSSLSGQINQFQGVMVHCDGKTRMRNAVDNIANMLDASRGFRTSKTGKGLSGNAFQRKNQIRDIIYSDPDASKALEKIIDAATEEEYGNAMQELLYATSKMNRKSALDYVQTWRYLSMLGNPKTHVRNILGNVTFGGIRNLSNTNRSFIEKALEGYAHNHGLVIDRHGKISPKAILEANTDKPTSDAGKAAKEWFEKNQDKILGGEGKYAENTTKASSPAYLKWLDGLSDANSKALQAEDNFFRKRAYKQSFIKSYDQYVKDGKEITPELLEKIHNSSMLESQVATFNEFNELAQTLSKWSHPDYNASTGKKLIGWGVNAVMPFTKVPANIGKQAVNYSPIGVARGIANISNAAKTGDSKVFNRALDELSSGLTGTGIAALGFFLGKDTDMFTTNAGTDDYAAKFKKQQGVQNYSMLFKDPSSGETYSLTLDWLVPASATFFAGVEMANQMKRGYGDLFEFIGDMSQVTSRVIEPVLETSMLSGLYNIVEGARSSTGEDDKQNFLSLTLRELTQSYASSLVPTFQGQLARTAYDSDLQLTGESDWEYWMNSMKSKMGLATTDAFGTQALGADTTAYGDVKGEKKTGEDRLKSLLKNTLSPANIQKVDLDEVDQAKIKQYEDAVKNGADPQEMSYLFPKKQYKKQFTTGNLDVKLSNRDLSAYNQAKTTGGAEGARYALESIMFNRYTKDENGNKHSTADAYTPEQKAEIIQQFDGKSIRDVEKWVREQPQFKNSSEAEQKKVIDGLWSYSKQGKAQSAKRVGEQAVIKAQGGDVNEYNFNNEITEKKREALQPLVDSGIVTYEQAVDFARYAGKTYYYEDDEGGHSQTYYNKGVMYDYLDKMGYDDETKAALFNAFKAWNAKEYGSSSSKGRRRRSGRRRGYRSYGGGSSAKATVPKPKTIKASSFSQGEALVSKRSSSSAKVTPPTLKRVQAKIDLPTKR